MLSFFKSYSVDSVFAFAFLKRYSRNPVVTNSVVGNDYEFIFK